MASSTWVRGKCIGKGSFASVSLGFNKLTGRVFAVKSVDLNSGHPLQIESLENEIRILQSLDYSPYVVQYLGDDEYSGRRNLHLEFLQGGTVADAAFRGKFGEQEESVVRRHTRCLLSALKHIHSRGIVHCDVKGRNVILDFAGGAAKLADFGSAVKVGASTAKIEPRGSPLWMAPEVVRGEYQGPESDVWALGCTLIEMVTGMPPWEDHGADILRRIGFSEELPEFPAQLSDDGRDFLQKCLKRDPRERWTCDQLLQHPFMESATATSAFYDSSPRCVLEWDSSDLDDDEENVIDNNTLIQNSITMEQAGDRLSKLFSQRGANWESEDWLEVRNSSHDELDESCCRSEYAELEEQEAPGTSSIYSETWRAESSIEKPPEYLNNGGAVAVVERDWDGGLSCQHGTCEGSLAGEGKTEARNLIFYGICNLLLFSRYLVMSAFCSNNNYKIELFYVHVSPIIIGLFNVKSLFTFTEPCGIH